MWYDSGTTNIVSPEDLIHAAFASCVAHTALENCNNNDLIYRRYNTISCSCSLYRLGAAFLQITVKPLKFFVI